MIMRKGVIMSVTLGMICDHALITKYSYWDRQNLDSEKVLYICLFELLFCFSR